MKQIMDGNQAAAYVSYAFSEAASLFPITPSSKMSELTESWSSKGKQNIFGESPEILVMNSEANVAGSMHGLLKSGILATTYTSSQGLLLMIPAMYKLAGELLPGVFHVAARSIASSTLNIYGDHSDVMAVRQTGVVMISASSVQETALFAAVSHVAAIKCRLPVVHFFDGFDTSHELRKIQLPEYSELANYVDQGQLDSFKKGLSNFSPKMSGTTQGEELYFQQREAANLFYVAAEGIVEETIQQLNPLFGTTASSVDYYGSPNATSVIVMMGSIRESAERAVDYYSGLGEQVGVIIVHLYRPFPKQKFLEVIPQTVQRIAVLDRTKEPGATGEPLFLDIQQIISESNRPIKVIGGRYGIGGKQTSMGQLAAVFNELKNHDPKAEFTIGINDDVTKLSLPQFTPENVDDSSIGIEILGVGSDGAMSAAKDFLHLIGEETTMDVKGDFHFPATKSRGRTTARLLFSDKKMKGMDEEQRVDYLVCNDLTYLKQAQSLERLKTSGKLILNTTFSEQHLSKHLSDVTKYMLAEKRVSLYIFDANQIARKFQLGPKISPLMMANLLVLTSFLPNDNGIEKYKRFLLRHDYMENQDYRQAVFDSIDLSISMMRKYSIDGDWGKLEVDDFNGPVPDFQHSIVSPIQKQLGNTISTCDLLKNGMVDGSIPLGYSTSMVTPPTETLPCWELENCRQCNICSLVCPHGAIRPFVNGTEKDKGDYKGKQNLDYRVLVDPEKCTGCQLCVEACPARSKNALSMKEATAKLFKEKKEQWQKAVVINDNQVIKQNLGVRESQFVEPLLKYSGACAGCGETPYVKLLTQLFGERLSITNATGCSSIWSASSPFSAFYQNKNGMGPVWSSSLFENNSAFGLGIEQGFMIRQKQVYDLLRKVISEGNYPLTIRKTAEDLLKLEGKNLSAIQQFIELTESSKDALLQKIVALKGYLVKRTHWLIGGDGWAYDIDFGGLDHLIASGQDCNILILDNEGYANTGGQLSKGTPLGAKVKFASNGNKQNRKDFGLYAMQYGEVFVAQVSLFAHPSHTLKVLKSAEEYSGPSIVIAYSPCVMNKSSLSAVESSKEAVSSGFWPLYTYSDRNLNLYSKEPTFESFSSFLQKQSRYNSLDFSNEKAKRHYATVKQRYFNYLLIKELGESVFGKEEKN